MKNCSVKRKIMMCNFHEEIRYVNGAPKLETLLYEHTET